MTRPATLLAITAALIAAPGTAAERSDKLIPSITVTGTGEVHAKPDLAHVNVGVVSEASTAAEALKQNTAAMEELFAVLKRRGIDDKDIQTSNFSVSPKYQYDRTGSRPPAIVGYTVSNQVNVKVRQLASLGAILDEVVRSGANRVQAVSFAVDDPTNLMDDARVKALADARRKAGLYAKMAEVKLGKPLLIQEQVFRIPEPMPVRLGMMAAADAAAPVPVAPGEQTITATVSVTYAIEE